jgi:hypothetical protein
VEKGKATENAKRFQRAGAALFFTSAGEVGGYFWGSVGMLVLERVEHMG